MFKDLVTLIANSGVEVHAIKGKGLPTPAPERTGGPVPPQPAGHSVLFVVANDGNIVHASTFEGITGSRYRDLMVAEGECRENPDPKPRGCAPGTARGSEHGAKVKAGRAASAQAERLALAAAVRAESAAQIEAMQAQIAALVAAL